MDNLGFWALVVRAFNGDEEAQLTLFIMLAVVLVPIAITEIRQQIRRFAR